MTYDIYPSKLFDWILLVAWWCFSDDRKKPQWWFEWQIHSKHCYDASSFTRPPPPSPPPPPGNSTLSDYPPTSPPTTTQAQIIVPANDSMRPTLNRATTAVQRGEFDAFILVIFVTIVFKFRFWCLNIVLDHWITAPGCYEAAYR